MNSLSDVYVQLIPGPDGITLVPAPGIGDHTTVGLLYGTLGSDSRASAVGH
jgi:hypothetical protein